MGTTYNGWTNYETWVVNLWLTNTAESYGYWIEQAILCFNEAVQGRPETSVLTISQNARLSLADRLKEDHEYEEHPVIRHAQGTVYADLLSAALGAVDWDEIANSLLSEIEDYEAR